MVQRITKKMIKELGLEGTEGVHDVWFKFEKWAVKRYGKEWEDKLHGINVIRDLERYVRYNPKVKLISVDDTWFAGSYLLLIPHSTMGNTVYVVPQFGAKNGFFLYPHDQKELIKTLKENTHNKRK